MKNSESQNTEYYLSDEAILRSSQSIVNREKERMIAANIIGSMLDIGGYVGRLVYQGLQRSTPYFIPPENIDY